MSAIRAHPIFQRDGANIFMRVPLRMTQAALGGEVEVPAIDGSKAKVKIPPGTQTGDQFRLRSKGFSVLRSAVRGDMYIQVVGGDAAEPVHAASTNCWRSSRPRRKATAKAARRARDSSRR